MDPRDRERLAAIAGRHRVQAHVRDLAQDFDTGDAWREDASIVERLVTDHDRLQGEGLASTARAMEHVTHLKACVAELERERNEFLAERRRLQDLTLDLERERDEAHRRYNAATTNHLADLKAASDGSGAALARIAELERERDEARAALTKQAAGESQERERAESALRSLGWDGKQDPTAWAAERHGLGAGAFVSAPLTEEESDDLRIVMSVRDWLRKEAAMREAAMREAAMREAVGDHEEAAHADRSATAILRIASAFADDGARHVGRGGAAARGGAAGQQQGHPAAGAIIGGAMMSPRGLSMEAITLGNPAVQQFLRQLPRATRIALMKALATQPSPTTPPGSPLKP